MQNGNQVSDGKDKLPVEVRAQMLQGEQSIYFNIAKFEHAQRIVKMFSEASMVPKHFQGNIGNCMIALNYAERIGADPFMVMQNIYIVHGRPGVEGKLIIALINQSGKYSEPLKYKFDGQGDDYGCTAWTREGKSGEIVEGPKVTFRMVKEEGWNRDKKNEQSGYVQKSKWNTMPEMMYRYRAASYFANVHCPELKLGMSTVEELHDFVELQRGADGSFTTHAPQPDQAAATAKTAAEIEIEAARKASEAEFARVFADELKHPRFAGWTAEAAQNYDCSVEEMKTKMLGQVADVKAAFAELVASKAPAAGAAQGPNGPPPSEDPGAHDEQKPGRTETAANGPEAEPHKWDRPNWIRLKGPGFSTFVWKNISDFSTAPADIQSEAKTKWASIYPENPWPGDAVNPAAAPQEGLQGPPAEHPATTGTPGDIDERQMAINECKRYPAPIVTEAKRRMGFSIVPSIWPPSVEGCDRLLDMVVAVAGEQGGSEQ